MYATLLTDASWCPHTGAGGYGFWIACERAKLPGGGSFKGKVEGSNAAELMAIVNSVYHIVTGGIVQRGDHILIQTDSLAAIGAIEGKRHTLGKQERKARQEFFRLVNEHKFRYTLKHVKAHTNREESRFVANRMCDLRAKQGMGKARKQMKKEAASEA